MHTFFIQFEATPPTKDECLGAYIISWIVDEHLYSAIERSRAEVESMGWTILGEVEAEIITRESQLPDGMQYFEQAQIDGEVWVFHCFNSRDDE